MRFSFYMHWIANESFSSCAMDRFFRKRLNRFRCSGKCCDRCQTFCRLTSGRACSGFRCKNELHYRSGFSGAFIGCPCSFACRKRAANGNGFNNESACQTGCRTSETGCCSAGSDLVAETLGMACDASWRSIGDASKAGRACHACGKGIRQNASGAGSGL